MRHGHLVTTSAFDFHFFSEAIAFEEQETLSTLVSRSLVPVMEEVFDEVSSGDAVLRLDRLDVDLGEVALRDYRQALPERLRRRLRAALQKQLDAHTLARKAGSKQATEDGAYLALIHFLDRGTLPWYTARTGGMTLDQLLDDVLSNHLDRLSTALDSKLGPIYIDRLVDQFSHVLLERLIAALAHTDGGPETSLMTAEGQDEDRRVWRARITQALRGRKQSVAEPARTREQRRLARLLSRAILTGRPLLSKTQWRIMVREDAPTLSRALRRHGQRADVRRRIAEGFSEPALRDMVVVLEPLEAGFVNEIVSTPSMFAKASEHVPEKVTRRRLWEFSLSYLIVDRGSRFNKRTYLESVIRQMAARENERYEDMLSTLSDVMAEVKLVTPATQEMRRFLSELAGVHAAPSRRTVPTYVKQPDEISRKQTSSLSRTDWTPAKRAEIVSALFESRKIEELVPLWEELISTSPELLLNTVLRYGRRQEVVSALVNGLPLEMLCDLMRLISASRGALAVRASAWLEELGGTTFFRNRSTHQANTAIRCLVLSALIGETQRGFSPDRFFNRLVTGIASQDSTTSAAVLKGLEEHLCASATPGSSPSKSPRPSFSKGELEARHSWDAMLDRILETGNIAALYPIWQRLIGAQKESLLAAIFRRGANSRIANRLATGLSEAMLKELVYALGKEQSAAVESTRSILSELLQHHTEHVGRTKGTLQQNHDIPNPQSTALKKRKQLRTTKRQKPVRLLYTSRYSRGRGNLSGANRIPASERVAKIEYVDESATTKTPYSPFSKGKPLNSPFEKGGREDFENTFSTPASAGMTTVKKIPVNLTGSQKTTPFARRSRRGPSGPKLYVRSMFCRRGRTPSRPSFKAVWSVSKKQPPKDDNTRHSPPHSSPRSSTHANTSQTRADETNRIQLWTTLLSSLFDTPWETFDSRKFDAAVLRQAAVYMRRSVTDAAKALNACVKQLIEKGSLPKTSASRFAPTPLRIAETHARAKNVEEHVPPIETELLQLLGTGTSLKSEEIERLRTLLGTLKSLTPRRLDVALEQRLRRIGEVFIGRLPDEVSNSLLSLTSPEEARRALPYSEILRHAAEAMFPSVSSNDIKRIRRQCLFRLLVIEGRRFNGVTFATDFLRRLNRILPSASKSSSLDELSAHVLTVSTGEPLLRRAVYQELSLASADTRPDMKAPQPAEPTSWTWQHPDAAATPKIDQVLFIDNAGLVLAAPFLPRLFSILGLTKEEQFADPESQRRAVHITQYIVNERTDMPEFDLPLNKILCGIPEMLSIPDAIELTDQEKETTTNMIKGMIQHWKVVRNSSVNGFRESFLQREGRLSVSQEELRLYVEPRAFDMLLDQIPWSFNIIKFPWMEQALYVDWR